MPYFLIRFEVPKLGEKGSFGEKFHALAPRSASYVIPRSAGEEQFDSGSLCQKRIYEWRRLDPKALPEPG